jgi:FtsH-binding integral membrane protein
LNLATIMKLGGIAIAGTCFYLAYKRPIRKVRTGVLLFMWGMIGLGMFRMRALARQSNSDDAMLIWLTLLAAGVVFAIYCLYAATRDSMRHSSLTFDAGRRKHPAQGYRQP